MNEPVKQSVWEAPLGEAKQKRIQPISNVIHVRQHMVRIFKEARRGEMKVEDASRLIYMLSIVQKAFESSDVEKRLKDLENSV